MVAVIDKKIQRESDESDEQSKSSKSNESNKKSKKPNEYDESEARFSFELQVSSFKPQMFQNGSTNQGIEYL
jgi:hypothetical protein